MTEQQRGLPAAMISQSGNHHLALSSGFTENVCASYSYTVAEKDDLHFVAGSGKSILSCVKFLTSPF